MLSSDSLLLCIQFGEFVFNLFITGVLKQDSLTSNVSYLRSLRAINDLLEEENVIF